MSAACADRDLERVALGACVLDPAKLLDSQLLEADFWHDDHREVWRALLGLHADGEPVNTYSLRARLLDRNRLAQAGGEDLILGLTDGILPAALPLERLKRLTRLRRLETALRSAQLAVAQGDEATALAELEAGAGDVRRAQETRAVIVSAGEMASEWIERQMRGPTEGTISPGLPVLKRLVGRWEPGHMTVIGAATSVGKSSLALEIALCAIQDGESVGWVSVEDAHVITTSRLIAMLSGVSARALRYVSQEHSTWGRVDRACHELRQIGHRFSAAYCAGMNEQDIMNRMTIMARAGAKIVVVDYVGRIKLSYREQDRRNEVRIITGALKDHAFALGVHLVLVSQISRPSSKDPSAEPTKNSFKEASDIEDGTEYAILMWRQVEDDFAPIFCKLAKSKAGGTGAMWVMQRELSRPGTNALDGSGRLIEVLPSDRAQPIDENGERVELRPVFRDPSGAERWSV